MKAWQIVAATIVIFTSAPGFAWNARGHMVVAAVAWDKLTPIAKSEATRLLRLNPNYAAWTAGVSDIDRDKFAFMKAATWPDEIRSDEAYDDDGYEPTGPTAAQNIGYSDKILHRSWHFKDYAFSPDGTALKEPFPVNAEAQIATFVATLGTSASDDVESFDLSWLLHLVGDMHQPLHATSRFTSEIESGDNGGNSVKVCTINAANCDKKRSSALHSFWDGAIGTSQVIQSASLFAEKRLSDLRFDEANDLTPATWSRESFEIAQAVVYDPPIGKGKGPYRLTSAYRMVAGPVAERRIALAGMRLANILNERFR